MIVFNRSRKRAILPLSYSFCHALNVFVVGSSFLSFNLHLFKSESSMSSNSLIFLFPAMFF